MDYDLKKPCNNCPFLREGGVRLHPLRVRDIAGGMLSSQGAEFACHKTTTKHTDDDDKFGEDEAGPDSKHCAGALIFALKNDTMTQMMRICHRIRAFDPETMMADKPAVESVFDTFDEMFKKNREEFAAEQSPKKEKKPRTVNEVDFE